MKITISRKQKFYVIPCGSKRKKGYTCLGFRYTFAKAMAIAGWLNERGMLADMPNERSVGKIRGYREYERILNAAKVHYQKTNQRCPVDLSEQLIGLEGKRIEVVDVFGECRRFYVGKSTGWVPCHLEIARIDSTGGTPVTGTPFRSIRLIHGSRRY